MQPVARRCNGVRRDGGVCTAAVVLRSGYCHAHDPSRQAGLRAAQVSGGKHRSTASRSLKALPPELRPVWQALVDLPDAVRAEQVTPQQASAIAAVAGKLLDYARFAQESGELTALEQRLAQLEAEQRDAGRRPAWR